MFELTLLNIKNIKVFLAEYTISLQLSLLLAIKLQLDILQLPVPAT
jgi:hypothetical protein